jgi:acetyl esterase/lipase
MNAPLLTVFLVLALSPLAFAQTPATNSAPDVSPFQPPLTIPPGLTVSVWPDGKMPGIITKLPEIRNSPPPGGVIRITNISHPTLEVFKAPGATNPVPAMIISPGGGYALLAYNREGTEIAAWLNSIGITGIVLKYRTGNRESALKDIQRAMRLTRAHAAEWGIAPDKLGVIGFSAGGHLSARLSDNYDKDAYPAIDDVDKQNCRPDYVILVYPGYLGDTGKLAPETTPSSKTPQTLLVHTEDDLHHFMSSKVYDAALTAAGVPHAFLLYPTGGHGFSLHGEKAAKVWPTQAADWLRKIGVL